MKTISEPREDYKPFVPRIKQFEISKEFIGAVIGKGGETIQKIQAETGATIAIDEIDGKGIVDIATDDAVAMQKAYDWIMGICAVPEVGETYHGTVKSILDFGAFIEILPGKEGLLHVSEIAWAKTEKVEDVLKVGDEVDVKLLEYDAKSGKMRLSMKVLTDKPEGYVEPERRPRNNDRGNGGYGRREGNDRSRNGGDRERRNGGDRRNAGDRERRNGGDRRNGGERRFNNRNTESQNSQDFGSYDGNNEPDVF